MNLKKKLLIIGGKFSAKISIEILKNLEFEVTVFDSNLNEKFFEGNYEFSNDLNHILKKIENKYFDFFFICIGNNETRKNTLNQLNLSNMKAINVISKDKTVLNYSKIGYGNLIYSGVNIDYFTKIGSFNVFVNSTLITHDNIIGNFNFIAPGVILLGNSTIGNNVFIGAGSIIDSSLTICDNVIIGANSFVNFNIDTPGKYYGNPAKLIT